MYYGFDPFKDKIVGYKNPKSAERIMQLLSQARKDIQSIKKNAMQLQDIELQDAMQQMSAAFEKIVKHIENDPDDYEKARKYLVSYLAELQSISETFVKLKKQNRATELREPFLDTLKSTIEKLDRQYDKLLSDDMMALDIKLSVMKQRVENEE
jgi:5-bromo-4-chloroindolyl phosphate hydrolysis protein